MPCIPIHPGTILADELAELGISTRRLAELLEVPPNRLYRLLAGKRSVTADAALRLGRFFGMSPEFWMNLQTIYELDLARNNVGNSIGRIPHCSEVMADPPAA